MELQSVTAKVDALRTKGFSDEDINQLLGTEEKAAPTQHVDADPDSIIKLLNKGNVQMLQQFAAGKDPEIFNAKIDEIVEYMEKSTVCVMVGSLIVWGGFIYGCYMIDQAPFDPSGNPPLGWYISGFSLLVGFILMGVSNVKKYKFLKPRILYFIRK
ncbi:hypothetical protein C9J21_21880 [Photobacterium phosphoreum]|uniref:hypothetical protein n=1 Tax=Photobacterium phosphoreum TaxID=659 RepID=UPI000D16F52D|nr:hypothetical protein [Photobacterium phosphoreum]PSW24740.1 hypothetical protein C9J21_21880 [Photobacterium phosphoreum]